MFKAKYKTELFKYILFILSNFSDEIYKYGCRVIKIVCYILVITRENVCNRENCIIWNKFQFYINCIYIVYLIINYLNQTRTKSDYSEVGNYYFIAVKGIRRGAYQWYKYIFDIIWQM